MFTNPAPKLLAAVVIIVLAVIVTIQGMPGQGGLFGIEEKELALGPDLSGGTTLIYSVVSYEVAELENEIARQEALEQTPERQRQVRQMRGQLQQLQDRFERNLADYMRQTREVLQERLDATGLAAIDVIATGQDQIEVTLPAHMALTEEIERVLTASGRMYFRMEVDTVKRAPDHLRDLQYPENPDPLRYRWFRFADTANKDAAWHTDEDGVSWILIEFDPRGDYPVLHGEDLEAVYPAHRDPTRPDDRYPVGFEFEGEHSNRFAQLTRQFQENQYRDERGEPPRLSIIFNEQVYWAGTIQSEIVGAGTMSGFGSSDERQFMINLIRSGSLPVQLQHESTSERGASLGLDAISQGVLSIVIGGILVALFVLIYYLGPGIIAVLSLLANLFIIFGVLVLFAPAATLTLPGIAGIILTVGMAIDANVLIFERIREERRRLASLKEAVQRGYERSTVTILDANLTTAITALILLVVGTPEIRGFATTLIIGIAATLFTTLVFGRYAIGTLIVSNTIQKFRMFRLLGDTRIPFMKVRAGFFTAATVIIILTMGFFLARGNDNLGIDFLGGHAFIVQLEEEADIADIRRAVALYGERMQAKGADELQEVAELEQPEETEKLEEDIEERFARYLRAEVVPVFPPGVPAGQTRSTMFELRFPFDPDRTGARVDQEMERRQIFGDLYRIFSGEFALNPEADDPEQRHYIPALVPEGIQHDFEDVTELGFRIRVPLTSIVTDDMLGTRHLAVEFDDNLGEVMPQADPGTLAYFIYRDSIFVRFPVSPTVTDPETGMPVEGSIRGLQEHHIVEQGETELPRPQIRLEARDHELMIYVGGITVDSEQIRSKADLAEYIEEVQQELEASFTDEGLAEARRGVELDTNREIEVEPVLERGRLTIDYRLNRPIALNQWNLDLARELAEDPEEVEAIEDDPFEGRMVYRLESRIIDEVSGVRDIAIPEGTEGTRLVPGSDPAMVQGFRVVSGESSFRRVSDPAAITAATEPTGREAIERISSSVRLFLGTPEYQLGVTLEEPFLLSDTKGPRIAEGLRDRATLAILLSLGFVVLYIWFRFRAFSYGLGATIAVAHDILFALGLIALIDAFTNFSVKIDLTVVAALLTIIGYSLNDTIVVFDRIRENRTGASKKLSLLPFINTSINEMLSRTVITSMTTFFVVFVLVLFGGAGLQGFAITLAIGILVGTFSSVFIAAPLVSIPWKRYQAILWGALALGFLWALAAIWLRDLRVVWFGGDLLLNFAVYTAGLFLVSVWLVALFDFFTRSKQEKADAFIDQAGGRVISREASLEQLARDQGIASEEGGAAPATEHAQAFAKPEQSGEQAQQPASESASATATAPEASGETTSSDEEGGEASKATAPAESEASKPSGPEPAKQPEPEKPASSKPANSGGGGKGKSKGKGHQRGKGKGGKKGKKGKR